MDEETRDKALEKARKQLSEAEQDQLIVRAVKQLEQLEKELERKEGEQTETLQQRDELKERIIEESRELIPNLSEFLGPLLAAKLLALAGNLEDLAKSPASTIQTLGAEKALFRHLAGEGTSPKHGVLFQHRLVQELPEGQQGKMARFLANKTAIAARLDQYGDKQKGKELRDKAQEKYEEMRE